MSLELTLEPACAKPPLGRPALGQLFTEARTHYGWAPDGVSEEQLRDLYDLLKWGPTSANCSPARFVFVVSEGAKQRLAPHLHAGNRPKMLQAPVCVIVGHDLDFASELPKLFPHQPGAAAWFADPAVAEETAFRNGSLQGGYLIMAARALGLDCGPMSGFDHAGVDREFFPGGRVRSNFLCNLGRGAREGLNPRLPRLPFEAACRLS